MQYGVAEFLLMLLIGFFFFLSTWIPEMSGKSVQFCFIWDVFQGTNVEGGGQEEV